MKIRVRQSECSENGFLFPGIINYFIGYLSDGYSYFAFGFSLNENQFPESSAKTAEKP